MKPTPSRRLRDRRPIAALAPQRRGSPFPPRPGWRRQQAGGGGGSGGGSGRGTALAQRVAVKRDGLGCFSFGGRKGEGKGEDGPIGR